MKRFDFYTAPELCSEFGARLRQQRLLKNISQEELAIQAGLGSSTIQRFEQGKGGTFENFLRIVRLCRIKERPIISKLNII